MLGIHDSSISDDIVAGFIPFFHRAVSNVKAGNQYIHFFFDFGDILGVESSYSIGTSKKYLAAFIFKYSSACKLISLQTVACIIVDKLLFRRIQFGDSLMGTDPYIFFLVFSQAANNITGESIGSSEKYRC